MSNKESDSPHQMDFFSMTDSDTQPIAPKPKRKGHALREEDRWQNMYPKGPARDAFWAAIRKKQELAKIEKEVVEAFKEQMLNQLMTTYSHTMVPALEKQIENVAMNVRIDEEVIASSIMGAMSNMGTLATESVELAREAEHPRAYEVAGNVNKDLLEMGVKYSKLLNDNKKSVEKSIEFLQDKPDVSTAVQVNQTNGEFKTASTTISMGDIKHAINMRKSEDSDDTI